MSETKTLLTAYIQGLSDSDCEKLWNFLNSEASSKIPSVGKNESQEKFLRDFIKQLQEEFKELNLVYMDYAADRFISKKHLR